MSVSDIKLFLSYAMTNTRDAQPTGRIRPPNVFYPAFAAS